MSVLQFAVVAFIVGFVLRFTVDVLIVHSRRTVEYTISIRAMLFWGLCVGIVGLGLGWLWNL